jgi:hypothetical protein
MMALESRRRARQSMRLALAANPQSIRSGWHHGVVESLVTLRSRAG